MITNCKRKRLSHMALEHQNDQARAPEKITKKPFNKKKWREQRYSNKAKVLKWENTKRKQALRQYNKELKKAGITIQPNFRKEKEQPQKSRSGSIKHAQSQYEKLQREKEERRKEKERIRREREEAIKAYKEKKAMKFRKLSQKTRRGQPVMRGRIELLLEKIEKQYGKHDNLFPKS